MVTLGQSAKALDERDYWKSGYPPCSGSSRKKSACREPKPRRKRRRITVREDIYWVCTFKVKPEQFDEFRQLVAPLVAATKQEEGALAYEYNVSDDRTTVHILEHYRDSDAVVLHVESTFAKFADRFTSLAVVASFVVYGVPKLAARKILDGFGAVYMTPFDGFTR
jgi:quinol monooxygenase YgiN